MMRVQGRRFFARAWRACVAGLLLLTVGLIPAMPAPARAESGGAASGAGETAPTPGQVQDLLKLLADPAVQDWIAHAATRPVAATGQESVPPPERIMLGQYLAGRLTAMRAHLVDLGAAVPTLSDELERAWIILSLEFQEHGLLSLLLLIAAFAAIGYGTQMLFWRLTGGWRQRVIGASLATVHERLTVVFQRLLYGISNVLAFAIGSVGAFLVFSWPPLLQEIVVAGLFVFIATRTAAALGRFALSPGGPRFRVLPMPQAAAEHWFFWVQLLTAYTALELVLFDLLSTLGVSEGARDVLILAWACGGLTLALVALFRRPAYRERLPGARTRTRLLASWLCLAMVARAAGVFPLFVLLIVLVGLPAALVATRRAVTHLLRPVGSEAGGIEPPGMAAAALERGLQAALAVGGICLVAASFGLGIETLSHEDTPFARLARGVVSAVVVLLAADLLWHLARSWIDCRLFAAGPSALAGHDGDGDALSLSAEEARRRARELTLLPILRNVGFIVLAVTAIMMALSALGVEVGPLLAGAGVVGVAVGFGAQTLVKDIISGMFYLLDDAFRVGEYVQSGNYKGTVESFSLRSVKLRHHRGPLYTVPFGTLGAIQNLSRDWVIDKIQINVTYDTDLDLVKTVVKQVSKEIMAEPELARHIIEPLKSQGVYQLGDFAIAIRMKIMTKPGEQFVIRRSIYSKIKRSFDANGIRFAFPTVTVAGGEVAAMAGPAVAQQALELMRERPAAE